jgi:uncharacterized protein YkwD
VHHAPSGPSLLARVAAVVRRTRLVPLTVAGLVIVAMGISEPPPAGSGRPGTAALTSPSQQGRVLVPATGDGWTQDGLPAPSATGGAPDAAAPAPTSPSAPRTSAEPPSSSSPVPTPAPTSAPAPAPRSSTAAGTSASTGLPSSVAPSSSAAGTPSSAPPAAPAEPAAVPDGAAVVLAAVDAARVERGCAPLAVDPGLAATAAAHSAAMRDAGALTAPSPEGLAVALTAAGADADAVAADWLDGDGAAPLGCDLTSAGAAVVDGWWTLLAT